jgi:hypothetical protein
LQCQVRGKIVSGTFKDDTSTISDTYVFLQRSQELWRRPKNESSEIPHGEGLTWGDPWPFSFALPKEVIIAPISSDAESLKTYRLPQTFSERSSNVSVQYEFILDINRTFFRPNKK